MNLSDLKAAGSGANQLIDAVNAMNTVANTYGPKYDQILADVRATSGDARP